MVDRFRAQDRFVGHAFGEVELSGFPVPVSLL
jgi:hypothetical protein